jgi:site-specific recombinase XerD
MIRVNFYLRKDVTVLGEHPIYIRISGGDHPQERINSEVYVNKAFWNDKDRCIKKKNQLLSDKQLILDNIINKFTDIRTTYRLTEIVLTPKIARDEYENKLSRVNFNAFFDLMLKEEKSKFAPGTYRRHESVLEKLKEYQNYLPFHELNVSWFNRYRNYLKDELDNLDTTINSNFSSIKKFLRIAVKNGIRLTFDVDDIKGGSTTGNRSYLNAHELKICVDYYFSPFITPMNRIVLGYFLFACMTGLRKSNILDLDRRELLKDDFSLVVVKSNKDKTISLNKKAKELIEFCPDLFVVKYSAEHINEHIKIIMKSLGITKHITLHVGRHTFATLFLKMGGKVEKLQQLLCHANIKETMIYVHIMQSEANEEIFLLDKIFE